MECKEVVKLHSDHTESVSGSSNAAYCTVVSSVIHVSFKKNIYLLNFFYKRGSFVLFIWH